MFTGNERQTVVCTYYSDSYDPERDCPALGDFGEFELFRTRIVTTFSLSGGVELGPVMAGAQLYAHLARQETGLMDTPVGADLFARLTF